VLFHAAKMACTGLRLEKFVQPQSDLQLAVNLPDINNNNKGILYIKQNTCTGLILVHLINYIKINKESYF